MDYNGTIPSKPKAENVTKKSEESSGSTPAPAEGNEATSKGNKDSGSSNKDDDVFSDSDSEEATKSSKNRRAKAASAEEGKASTTTSTSETSNKNSDQIASVTRATENVSLGSQVSQPTKDPTSAGSELKTDAVGGTAPALNSTTNNTESEFKVIAADASVFTFGDEDDYESE